MTRTESNSFFFIFTRHSMLDTHSSSLDTRHFFLSLDTCHSSCSVTEKIALDEFREDRGDHQLDVPLLAANVRMNGHVLPPESDLNEKRCQASKPWQRSARGGRSRYRHLWQPSSSPGCFRSIRYSSHQARNKLRWVGNSSGSCLFDFQNPQRTSSSGQRHQLTNLF